MTELDHIPGPSPKHTVDPDIHTGPIEESPLLEPLNVLVFGPTGAGKSTIINLLTNDSAKLPVGLGLESCTTDVSPASIDYRGRRITFFDTAGFDDTKKAPAEHLAILITRLDEMYKLANGRPHIHGAFYVHSINENRMTQSTKTNLRVIQELLGDHLLKNLVFVTNMWDPKPKPRHIRLEKELMQNDGYFGMAIKKGAKAGPAYRICEEATHSEVQEVLLDLFRENDPEVLQVQRELAGRDDVEIAATRAGRVLREGLEEFVRGVQAELENRETQLSEVPEGTGGNQQNLRQEIGELQSVLSRAEGQNDLLGGTIGFFRKVVPARLTAVGAASFAGGAGIFVAGAAFLGAGLIGAEVAEVAAMAGFGLGAGGAGALVVGGLVALYRAQKLARGV